MSTIEYWIDLGAGAVRVLLGAVATAARETPIPRA